MVSDLNLKRKDTYAISQNKIVQPITGNDPFIMTVVFQIKVEGGEIT